MTEAAQEVLPVCVRVLGRPAPKGSRIAAKTKAGKPYTYPASRYEKPWTQQVKSEAHKVMRHREQPARPYAVKLTFHLHKPRKNKAEMLWWPTLHDLDKLARCVIDGLVQGGAMEDDRHVCALTVSKEFAQTPEEEGVTAEIWGIAPPGGG